MRLFDVPLVLYAGNIEQLVVASLSAGLPHGGGFTDQLGEVLIWGDHVGMNASPLICSVSNRADNVIRLVTI